MPVHIPLSSLRVRLLLLVVLIAVPMLGVLFYNASVQHRLETDAAEDDLVRTVHLVSSEQERLLEETRVLLSLLAQLPVVRHRDLAACSAFVRDLLQQYPAYADFIVTGADGEVYCLGHPLSRSISLLDHASFKKAVLTRGFAIGDVGAGRNGNPRLSFGFPITDGAGRLLGVVSTGVDLIRVSRAMANASLPSGSTVTMIDSTGTILARLPDPEKWIGKVASGTPLFRTVIAHRGEGTDLTLDLDGVVRLAGYTKLRGLPQGQDVYVTMAAPRLATIEEGLVRNLVGLGVLGVLACAVAWLGITRYILRPIHIVARATKQLSAGDLSQRVETGSLTEIDELAAAFNTMADRLAAETRERTLLNEMGDLLQVCNTVKDASAVVARFGGQLFHATSGAVFVFHPSRDLVECTAAWGAGGIDCAGQAFAPGECWALQRGQEHVVEDTANGIVCRHLGEPLPAAYLCLPLVAQGDLLGILHLSDRVVGPSVPSILVTQQSRRLAKALSEQVAFAIANLRLRETLRGQSIRDPLTGLFNRRYLEETLEREIRRAERARRPLGILMFDIDRFKQFNDTFGHDAGDAVLREVGALLRTRFRGEDIACRYGGEEFVVILPDASIGHMRARAEELREVVKHLHVSPRGQTLGSVTLSIGVSEFPDHGATADALLRAADAALYRAKQNGRDRIEAAGSEASVDSGVGHPT
jgi:diguanylate cyclase (GGDEF)-like protein